MCSASYDAPHTATYLPVLPTAQDHVAATSFVRTSSGRLLKNHWSEAGVLKPFAAGVGVRRLDRPRAYLNVDRPRGPDPHCFASPDAEDSIDFLTAEAEVSMAGVLATPAK